MTLQNQQMSNLDFNIIYLKLTDGILHYSIDNISWDNIPWPFNIGENTTVYVQSDFTLVRPDEYFIIGGSNIIFNGSGHEVTIQNVTNYPGLIFNGSASIDGHSNIQVRNLGVVTLGKSTLAQEAGWIGQAYFGKKANYNLITLCYSTGLVDSTGCGGILGSYSGYDGSITVTNSYSTGDITGEESGGIFGSYAGFSGQAEVSNCYSTGLISLANSGGIFGLGAGYNGGKTLATNSYSVGIIEQASSGGIFSNSQTLIENKQEINCYTANGIWNDKEASENLFGNSQNTQNIWTPQGVNMPFLLLGFTGKIYGQNFIYDPVGIGTTKIVTSEPGLVSNQTYQIVSIDKHNFTKNLPVEINEVTGQIKISQFTVNTYSLSIRVACFKNKLNKSGYILDTFYINPIKLLNFIPNYGSELTESTISIFGTGLTRVNYVKFNNTQGTILKPTLNGQVTVKVPNMNQTGQKILSVTADITKSFTEKFLYTEGTVGNLIASIFYFPELIPVNDIVNAEISKEHIQTLYPLSDLASSNITNRDNVIKTLFDIYVDETTLLIPSELLNLPKTIEKSKSLLYNGTLSTMTQPVAINIEEIGNNGFFCWLKNPGQTVKFYGSGKFINQNFTITKDENNKWTISKYLFGELIETFSKYNFDTIKINGLSIFLDNVCGQVENITDTINLPEIYTIKTNDSAGMSFCSNVGGQEIKITGTGFYNFESVPFSLFVNDINVTNTVTFVSLNEIIFTLPKVELGPGRFRVVTLGGIYTNYNTLKEVTTQLFDFVEKPTITNISQLFIKSNVLNNINISGTGFFGIPEIWLADENYDYKSIITNVNVISDTLINIDIEPMYWVGSLALVLKTTVGTTLKTINFSNVPEIIQVTNLETDVITTAITGSTQNIFLIGHDFNGTKKISFNGIEITEFTIVSNNRIQLVTPPINTVGSVEIYVETWGGSSINNKIYTIVSAEPTITAVETNELFSKKSSTNNGNQPIRIIGTNFINSDFEPLVLEINGINVTKQITSIANNEINLLTLPTSSGLATFKIITKYGTYTNFTSNSIHTELFYFTGIMEITNVVPTQIPNNIQTEITIIGKEFYGNIEMGLLSNVFTAQPFSDIQLINDTTIKAIINPIDFTGQIGLYVKSDQTAVTVIDIVGTPKITSVELVNLTHTKYGYTGGDQEIKITGLGFFKIPGYTTQLKINDIDVSANIISISPTEIIVTTPKTTSGSARFYLNLKPSVDLVTDNSQGVSAGVVGAGVVGAGAGVVGVVGAGAGVVGGTRTIVPNNNFEDTLYVYKNYIDTDNGQTITTDLFTFAGNVMVTNIEPAGVPNYKTTDIVIDGAEFYGDIKVWFGNDLDDYKDIIKNVSVISSTKIIATINPTKYSGQIYLIIKSDVDIVAKSYFLLPNPKIIKLTDLNNNELTYGINNQPTDLYIIGTGFEGVNYVKFNGINQTFTTETTNKIKVTNSVINIDGKVSITVKTFGGTDTQDTIYSILGLPTISFVYLNNNKSLANKLGNENLVIVGTNFINLNDKPLELKINEQDYNLLNSQFISITDTNMEIVTKPTNISGNATFLISNKAGLYRNYSEINDKIIIQNNLLSFSGLSEITNIEPPGAPVNMETQIIIYGNEFYSPIKITSSLNGVQYPNLISLISIDSPNQITAKVNPFELVGTITINVTTDINTSSSTFIISEQPKINSIAYGTISNGIFSNFGDDVTLSINDNGEIKIGIIGDNLNNVTSVKLNGQSVKFENPKPYNNKTILVIIINADINLGPVTIFVETFGGSTSKIINIVGFDAPLSITNINVINNPDIKVFAKAGNQEIIINGFGFINIESLFIDSVEMKDQIINKTPTQIVLKTLPINNSGITTLLIKANGQEYTNSLIFADNPTITTITPGVAVNFVNTPIVITGSEFYGNIDVFLTTIDNVKFTTVSNWTVSNNNRIEATINPTSYTGKLFIVVKTDVGLAVWDYLLTLPPTVSSVKLLNSNKNIASKNGNETAKIIGTNFTNPILKINFELIHIISFTSTEITFTTNSTNSGTALLFIETDSGTYKNYDSDNKVITDLITFVGTPTITDVSPIYISNQLNTKITITGTDFYQGINVFLFYGRQIFNILSDIQVISNTKISAIVNASNFTTVSIIGVGYENSVYSLLDSQIFKLYILGTPQIINVKNEKFEVISSINVGSIKPIFITGKNIWQIQSIKFNNIDAQEFTLFTASSEQTWQVIPPLITVTGKVNIVITTNEIECFTTIQYISTSPIIYSVYLDNTETNIAKNTGGDSIKITGIGFDGFVELRVNETIIIPEKIETNQIIFNSKSTNTGPVLFYIQTNTGTYTNYQHFDNGINTITTQLFTFIGKPTITSIFPEIISNNLKTQVTINGTEFYPNSHIILWDYHTDFSSSLSSVNVKSSNQITLDVEPINFIGTLYFKIWNFEGESTYDTKSVYLYPEITSGPTVTSIKNKYNASILNDGSIVKSNSSNTIIITGTNFKMPILIKINGQVNDKITDFTPNEITLTTEKTASGPALISIETPNGIYKNYTELADVKTITSQLLTFADLPTITSLQPNKIKNNETTQVTITGTEFYGKVNASIGSNIFTDINYIDNTKIIVSISPVTKLGTTNIFIDTSIGRASYGIEIYKPSTLSITNVTDNSGNILKYGAVGSNTIIYLNGTGFLTVNQVKFAGNFIDYQIISDTQIKITNPLTANVGDVTFYVQNNSEYVFKSNIYSLIGSPTITTITPNVTYLNTVTNVTINGTNFTNLNMFGQIDNVIFSLEFAGLTVSNVTIENNTTIKATVLAQTSSGPVNVLIKTLGGSFTSTQLFNVSYQEQVISNPLYIKQDIGDVPKSKLGLEGSWIEISWPFLFSSTVTNIFFTTDLTLTGINQYFVIGANQQELNGNSHKVTISGVTGYNGLVKNGDPNLAGFSNTTVKNIGVESVGSTLASNSGWVCQNYYSYEALNNKITNCYSTGHITNPNSGGIVGYYAAASNSTAVKSEYASIYVSNCWSSGNITGRFSGGIFASYAGKKGKAYATNCYSTGSIGSPAVTGSTVGQDVGGIFGYGPGSNSGLVTATQCYSWGDVNGKNCGGIIGSYIANAVIYNCYSLGRVIGTAANSANGFLQSSGTIKIENFYGADGSWSVYIANENLTGYPTGSETIGTTWTSVGISSPYILTSFNNSTNSTVAPKKIKKIN